jgi:hypothetical protein
LPSMSNSGLPAKCQRVARGLLRTGAFEPGT